LLLFMLQLRKRVEEKNRLLRQMAAATPASAAASSSLTPVDLAGLSERWDGFVGQLQAYDSHLEGQQQGLQVQLGKKVEDFAGTVAGFASRWVQCTLAAREFVVCGCKH
jgi:hypothetical protein